MTELHIPEQIYVAPFGEQTPNLEEGDEIPTYSALFREDADFARVIAQAVRHDYTNDTFRAASIGASFGAEADSLVGLLQQHPYITHVTHQGYDINARAVHAANQGKYTVIPNVNEPEHLPASSRAALTTTGLTVETQDDATVIDSSQLRKKHTMTFMHDTINAHSTPAANLILANNVLFHYNPEQATSVMIDPTERLAVDGVLSIGKAVDFVRCRGNVPGEPSFAGWCRQTSSLLEKSGIVTVLRTARGTPYAFQRAS